MAGLFSRRKTLTPVLRRLERALAQEYRRHVLLAGRLGTSPGQAGPLLEGLLFLLAAKQEVQRALYERDPGILKELEARTLAELQKRPGRQWAVRRLFLRTLGLLNRALCEAPGSAPAAREVVVPSVLLYQAKESLFPPERLLVVAGQRTGDRVWLEAAFDVTGPSSAGHVRADPERLGRVLIAMERTDRFLAAWVHSHPGNGPEATRPSSTDLRQHEDWLRDYSPFLLGATFAGDWLRFWGAALDEGKVTVRVAGAGLTLEGEDGTLWRFA